MTEQKFHAGVKALIMNENKQILALRINPVDFNRPIEDHWDLPGGRIKENDSIEKTLHKEVEEELGIKEIQISELFDVCIANYDVLLENESVSLILIVYKCKLPDKKQKFKLNFEHLEYRWASLSEAKNLLSFKFPESFIGKLDLI